VGGSALLLTQRKVYEWCPLIATRNLQVGYGSAIDGGYCGALKINRRGSVIPRLPQCSTGCGSLGNIRPVRRPSRTRTDGCTHWHWQVHNDSRTSAAIVNSYAFFLDDLHADSLTPRNEPEGHRSIASVTQRGSMIDLTCLVLSWKPKHL
jgi:hypothetical protein